MSHTRGRKEPSTNSAALPTSLSAADRALTVMAAFFAAQAKATTPVPAPVEPIEQPPVRALPCVQLVALPFPPPAMELLQFIKDLNHIKGIDVHGLHAVLEASAITPHLLAHLGLNCMMELMGLLEGHALTMQLFSKEWAVSLDEQWQLDTYN